MNELYNVVEINHIFVYYFGYVGHCRDQNTAAMESGADRRLAEENTTDIHQPRMDLPTYLC